MSKKVRGLGSLSHGYEFLVVLQVAHQQPHCKMLGARRLRRRILWPEGAELLLRILRVLILFY
ncbi:MAG: hypothetical protein ACRBBJ_14880, partial [Rhodomicrobiaceae bacterium]